MGPASREAVKNADFLKNVRFSPGSSDPRDLESGLGDRLLEKQTGSARKQKSPGMLLEKQTGSGRKQESPGRLLKKQTGSAGKQELPGRLFEKQTGSTQKQDSPGWERAKIWGTVVARIGLVLSLAFVLTYLLLMVLGHRIF